jgi:hypothetical protein
MNTIHLHANETMEALAKQAFGYTGRKFQVEAAERKHIVSYWDGGTRSYWAVLTMGQEGSTQPTNAIVENGKPQLRVIGECGGMNKPAGIDVEIDANTIVAEHVIFCGKDLGIRFYVNPARLPQYLPASANELTREQRIVLIATRSYKSSYAGMGNYRFVEAQRETGISAAAWERSKAECQQMGLLDKRGAITVEGRNAIGQADLWQYRNGQG